MSYIPNYYRPNFHRGAHDENDTVVVKTQESLKTIYSSSNVLQSLSIQETVSLYDFLRRNDIELNEYTLKGGMISDLRKKNADERDVDQEIAEEEAEDKRALLADPHEALHRYITLNELEKNNKETGDLVVAIEGLSVDILTFPALIENLVNFAIKRLSESIPSCKVKATKTETVQVLPISPEYYWSFMGVDTRSYARQNVFVSFADAMMLYLFSELVNDLKGKLKVITSKGFKMDVIPKVEELFELDVSLLKDVKEELKKHIDDLEYVGIAAKKSSNAENDDYITRCRKLAESYQVDSRDLSDVPLEMVDSVKQNIIDFRVHILKDLEEKKHESLVKLAQEIDTVRSDDKEYSAGVISEERAAQMSDIEYERVLQGREKAQNERAYQMHLGQYKKMEEVRIRKYTAFTSTTKHEAYVSKVVPANRKKFLAAFVEGVVDERNKIDSSFNYYIKHSNYTKYRLPAKEREEARDKAEETATV
jgi:hypothetical protein